MAKKIYELDMQQDADLIKIYDKSVEMSCALTDIYNYLREEIKYKEHPQEITDKLIEIRQKFFDILSDNDISI